MRPCVCHFFVVPLRRKSFDTMTTQNQMFNFTPSQ